MTSTASTDRIDMICGGPEPTCATLRPPSTSSIAGSCGSSSRPRVERTARSLYRSNQRRAMLTMTAAGSSSLPAVRAYESLLNAANRPVERAVRTLRRELGLPPQPSA